MSDVRSTHLRDPAQIGVTAPCPHCKAAVTVPNPSTLSPSLPPSPQPQSPPAADRGTARKSESSVLRILFVLLGIVGLFVSFVNGWMFGIIASVILILLAAVAK